MSLTVVVGGQAGSEGKGAVTAALHQRHKYRYAVRVGGPNAGHTVVDKEGQRFALRQVPVAAAVDHECKLVIASGSEVDRQVLLREIKELEAAGHPVKDRLLLDGEATLLAPRHAREESGIRTGTTGKGIGAARAERALRRATRMVDVMDSTVDTGRILRDALRADEPVMLEGTQGLVLGSHFGYYPHCTSGDCRAIDMMAAAGIPPMPARTVVCLRTYPIRIAGESGPLPLETSWHKLGLAPEYTTVTKKERRVGTWNWDWAKAAVEMNDPAEVALTFADYWWPDLAGTKGPARLSGPIGQHLEKIEEELGASVTMLGTGPSTQLWLGDERRTR